MFVIVILITIWIWVNMSEYDGWHGGAGVSAAHSQEDGRAWDLFWKLWFVHVCELFFAFLLCCPAMNRRPVQGVTLPWPYDRWEGLQQTPATTSLGLNKEWRILISAFKNCSLFWPAFRTVLILECVKVVKLRRKDSSSGSATINRNNGPIIWDILCIKNCEETWMTFYFLMFTFQEDFWTTVGCSRYGCSSPSKFLVRTGDER